MTGAEQEVVLLMTRVVQSVVSRPEQVSIQVVTTSMSTILRCFASHSDVKKLRGERRDVLESLKHLLLSFGGSAGTKFKLEVLSETPEGSFPMNTFH